MGSFSDLSPDNATVVNSNSDFCLELSRGNLTGLSGINKFGYTPDVDTSTDPQDLWEGGTLYPWPASAFTTTVVSTDTDDTSAGAGARTVEVQGLDSSYNLSTQEVTMNGTTAVTLGTNLLRVFRVIVLTAGSSNECEGDITVLHSSTVLAIVNNGSNQSLMAVYTVPAGKTAYQARWYVELNRTLGGTARRSAIIDLRSRPDGGVFNIKERRIVSDDKGVDVVSSCSMNVYAEKTDIVIRIQEVSGNNVNVSGGFDLILVDN